MWQKHGAEILNCNRQSYGATKTIWVHNFGFNWSVLKPNLSHCSFLKSLHKKDVSRTFWGLSGGGRSRFYKGLCTRVLLQNAVHDKSHPETRTSITHQICALWAKGTLSMDTLNLGETWLLDKKSRNLVEWDTFRIWLVIACNRQNRFDKSTAQTFLNCNRQIYGATKTI